MREVIKIDKDKGYWPPSLQMISLQPFSQMMAFYPNFARTEQVLSKPAINKETGMGCQNLFTKTRNRHPNQRMQERKGN